MKSFNGFKRYNGLSDIVSTIEKVTPVKTTDIKSDADIIMDKIFALDANGFPQPSLAVYLGEKTPDDIKRFIEQNILVLGQEQHTIQDEKVVAEFRNLESDFIAQASRNRYESIEEYEQRLQQLISDDEEQSFKKQRVEAFKKLLNVEK